MNKRTKKSVEGNVIGMSVAKMLFRRMHGAKVSVHAQNRRSRVKSFQKDFVGPESHLYKGMKQLKNIKKDQ